MGEAFQQPVVPALRAAFDSGLTRPRVWRVRQLEALGRFLLEREEELAAAVQADVGKPPAEVFFTETAFLQSEIRYALQHLGGWMRPKRAALPLLYQPATASYAYEPLGVVLIIGAWNYPLQLVLAPLVSAIAAGNCAVLKPSEQAPRTSACIAEGIRHYLDGQAFLVVEGGPLEARQLLRERFEHVFFTGSRAAGREVMRAAAMHPASVTLELGGRCPCIVDSGMQLKTVARRIAWAKFLNAGQTCIAPDYVLVRRGLERMLADALREALVSFYGPSPGRSPGYARVVGDDRLLRLEERFPGIADESPGGGRSLPPTILEGAGPEYAGAGDEIFGPVLPLVSYGEIGEAIGMIRDGEEPLAIYLFSTDRGVQQRVLRETRSGGVCINDLLFQAAVPSLPFGGVGRSGFGAYHGRAGFEEFSTRRSVMKRPIVADMSLRYPPYGNRKFRFLRWLLGCFQ
ncbi:aldehyde dehydrogenase family protein [Pelodictyon luteolum]|uniref:Aldehyde dehydrogenase n=1 Tax=Chlorobium luteolum (strain DSM 273 / BCRC 81028 / 2530) TaxID=319225 RepID=Q3B643_CHLL3|nr:aldehyde dehydrogenase family protein [Pelodictyon luteolum]ABB23188.1 aldehyde dehydrogenase [Pelodictyon luteolum DSM 273]